MPVDAHDDVRTGFPGDGKQLLKVFAGYGDGILDQQLAQRFCRGIVPLPSIFKNTGAYWITATLKEQVVLDEFILVSAAGQDTLDLRARVAWSSARRGATRSPETAARRATGDGE